MREKRYLIVSGSIFGLVACLHLVRLLYGLQVQVGTWMVPFWLSWGGFLGAAVLCTWAFWHVRKGPT